MASTDNAVLAMLGSGKKWTINEVRILLLRVALLFVGSEASQHTFLYPQCSLPANILSLLEASLCLSKFKKYLTGLFRAAEL